MLSGLSFQFLTPEMRNLIKRIIDLVKFLCEGIFFGFLEELKLHFKLAWTFFTGLSEKGFLSSMLIPTYFVLSVKSFDNFTIVDRSGKSLLSHNKLSPMAFSHVFTFTGFQTKFIDSHSIRYIFQRTLQLISNFLMQ